jgi:hypothetical protein
VVFLMTSLTPQCGHSSTLQHPALWALCRLSLHFASMYAVLESCRWHRRAPMTATRT